MKINHLRSYGLLIYFTFFLLATSYGSGKDIIVIPGLQLDFKNCQKWMVLKHRINTAKEVGDKKSSNKEYDRMRINP